MKAIEFQSQLENGKISVPADCGLQNGQGVRVLILVNEVDGGESRKDAGSQNIWDQIQGSWQGEPLVREVQGEYPRRLELE